MINIGILGTSEIAPRSIIAPAKMLDGVTIKGIASREGGKAEAYARKYSIPLWFKSYDDLIENSEIDAVYIPLITSLHAKWTLKAIGANKHVLVEKPICMTKNDVNLIHEASNQHPEITIMEALMSHFHPFTNELSKIITSKKYGKLKSIRTKACYTLDDETDFRLYPEKGGSAFYEEGILWCHLTQSCLGLKPIQIESNCDFNGPFGGDHTFHARIIYSDNIISECYCSYNDPYEANHYIQFEQAKLEIINFWRPTFGSVKLKIKITELNNSELKKIVFEPQNYYVNQLKAFKDSIDFKQNNNLLLDSLNRIVLMERIYHKALKGIKKSNL